MLYLAPDESLFKRAIGANFNAACQVNGWVQALLSSSVINTDPPQQCITDIQNSLTQCVNTLEASWVQDLMPKLMSTVPQAFVSFNDTFQPTAQIIVGIMDSLQDGTGNPSTQQKQELEATVTKLQQYINQTITDVEGLLQKSKKVISEINSFYTTVTQGSQSAQQILKVDGMQIINLKNQISALQQKLTDDMEQVQADENSFLHGIGDLLYSFTIGLAVNTMSGDVAADVSSIVTSVIEIGSSAEDTNKSTETVEEDVQNIANLQNQLDSDELVVAALQGLINTVKKLADFNNGILIALPQVINLWTCLGDACGQILEILNQPVIDLRLVSLLSGISGAASTWNDIEQYANSILDVNITNSTISLKQAGNGRNAT